MYCILDTVMMTVNMWRHHIFSVREITSDTISIEFVQDSIFYKTHFIFTYGVVITLLLCYVIMMIKASKFYRFRYAVIFMSLLIAFMLDISTISSNSIYDLSMVVFGIMSILIYYFTLRYELSVDREDDCRIYEIIYKRVYDDKGNFVRDYFMFND